MTTGVRAGSPDAAGAALRVSGIVGGRLDPGLHERLHRLEHRGALDVVEIGAADLPRRRFRALSRAGRTVEIALPREQALFDGAVLWLGGRRARSCSASRPSNGCASCRGPATTPWRWATTPATCIGACGSRATPCWSRWKRRPRSTLPGSARLAAPGRLDCGIIDAAPC